ncbi:MAG: tRNA uridine-5-carboxymethylaminomethyl(34) synthesis GTPase MnmE, partial [Prevotella sp.]|nr:tRNA uridine-5-carboxymethylaminomethyl(34) synthesis GTPase MnmE [Prevotella sp.]
MTQNSITGSVVGQDTICALATPAGGAIGVIRVSGPKAWQTVSKVFSKDLTTAKPNTLHYGEVHDAQGRTVDDVIVSLWKAPHSYTGEDAAELSCHGSAIVLSHVLNVL